MVKSISKDFSKTEEDHLAKVVQLPGNNGHLILSNESFETQSSKLWSFLRYCLAILVVFVLFVRELMFTLHQTD